MASFLLTQNASFSEGSLKPALSMSLGYGFKSAAFGIQRAKGMPYLALSICLYHRFVHFFYNDLVLIEIGINDDADRSRL